uniref:ABC transporter related n=1 Tax=Rhodopseudomonas palustris (strain BisA53) TaxID=316055 RepID=Q07LP2_RHOP5
MNSQALAPLLEIQSLSVSYGNVLAVCNVSLAAGAGQIVAIIGPNGAGKSTLLGAAMGLLRSTGAIVYQGADISRLDVEDRLEAGLCLVPERRELFADLTVADNLLLGAYLHRKDRAWVRNNLARVYDRFPRLAERRRQTAVTLSGGERQMLALGRALMSRPRLLMLDEPSLGLAPIIVREILRIVVSLRELGVTVLLVEQNARAALEISDYGYVLENGEFRLSGGATALMQNSEITTSYLGVV